MKKSNWIAWIAAAALLVAILFICLKLVGNRQLFDTTFTFQEAVLVLPDGQVVSGKIRSWRDYDGDTLQVRMESGETYVVHENNCVLIAR